MILYVVRHGESKANVDLGEYEKTPNHQICLTDNGKQQAEHTTKLLVGEMNRIAELDNLRNYDKIILWSSLYRRAQETAKIIHKSICCEYREDILLSEQNYGLATGVTSIEEHAESSEEQQQLFFKVGKQYVALPQGESMVDVAVRAELFIHKMIAMDFYYPYVIIVSHKGFNTMLHSQITGEYPDIWDWPNGSVRVYRKIHGHLKYDRTL